MKNIFRIIRLAKPLYKILFSILILSVVYNLLQLSIPLLTGRLVKLIEDSKLEDISIDSIYVILLIIFVLSILGSLLQSIQQRIGDHFGGEIRKFLTEKFYRHIFTLPQTYFDSELSGKIVNQLNRGIASIEQFMKTASNFIFPTFTQTIFTFIVLFIISWQVAIALLLLFPIYTYFSYRSAKKWGEEEIEKNMYEDNLRGRIQEVISNIKLVKGFTNQYNEWRYSTEQLVGINKVYARQSRTFHIYDFLRNSSLQIILLIINFIIFVQTFNGVYSFEELVILIQLVAGMQRPLFVMSFILSQIQTTESGTKEFFEILDLEEVEKFDETKIQISPVNKIEFKDVHFSYGDGNEVLHGVDLEFKKGETVALVGSSGAGKTTIINMIMKFYNPTTGKILIDNSDYSDLSHDYIRSHISLVFQENELFSTSIRENVSYGIDSTEDQIIEALRKARAWDFVKNLKDGIHTKIGERGTKLSGGQKQRIQIARALLHNRPIVILDEATSNLDSKSESEVGIAMEELYKNRIVIIIAHRFSTIQNVSKIIVLDAGNVEMQGSPHELANKEGTYKTLLQYQLEGDKKLLKNFEIY